MPTLSSSPSSNRDEASKQPEALLDAKAVHAELDSKLLVKQRESHLSKSELALGIALEAIGAPTTPQEELRAAQIVEGLEDVFGPAAREGGKAVRYFHNGLRGIQVVGSDASEAMSVVVNGVLQHVEDGTTQNVERSAKLNRLRHATFRDAAGAQSYASYKSEHAL